MSRNEAETRADLIDPVLTELGWGKTTDSRIKREFPITLGALVGGGKRTKPDIADYVLLYKGQRLAVIEAKKESLPDTEGLAQAKRYAKRLKVRFTYSTNGKRIYQVDMHTGKEGYVDSYPTPETLWQWTFQQPNVWREKFSAIPYEERGGSKEVRYYQQNAVEAALNAIIEGKDRILLTLATGTGKTYIAFQIAWKLFQSRWNVKAWRNNDGTERQPRILFLADRNILANQAFNDFGAFPEDALVRIAPETIRKKGAVPKNGNIFFTIFQTFMTGKDENGNPAPSFDEYPADFFDLIIIDECHRGGANDESTWRKIMEHFTSAVQLGLTATPKRELNGDTYDYFGDPVYTYALKDGINDGFLTPFRVEQFAGTLDDYQYEPDDEVVEGEIDENKTYEEKDFNVSIEIRERELHRVQEFMKQIDQNQKTIVFCANQRHALLIRDLINQTKLNPNPNYCVRVTANDGAHGETQLNLFQDNEKTIPTILTTSQKLSTGVDARNVRNIVLLRPVNSMIEFKQIIGRGTRLYEGKDYFTVYDFVKAHEHFEDEEWDGPPLPPDPCKRCGQAPCVCEKKDPEPCTTCGQLPCQCEPESCEVCGLYPCECEKTPKLVKVQLADGKARQIFTISATTFWSVDGKPISAAEFIERIYGTIPELFKDEDELRRLWSNPDTRKSLLAGFADKGYSTEQLKQISQAIHAERSDLYDVLAYIAYALPIKTREERVKERKPLIYAKYNDKQREFLDFVLSHYIDQGVSELGAEKLSDLIKLKYHSIPDATRALGDVKNIRKLFVEFQQGLY